MGHAIKLLRLLSCLCRRSLVLTDINKSGLLGVMPLQPTLLVNQPGQFPKIWQLCSTSNYHGVHVLGNCSVSRTPTLDERRQAEIAKRFQPLGLMYRLCNFGRSMNSTLPYVN